MRTSINGKIALAVSEGIVDTAYKDSVGVWTLGIGHTLGAGYPDPKAFIGKKMTISEVFDLFDKDLKKYEDMVTRNVRVPLLQHEFDALVHFVYNVGEGNLKKSKLLKNLNNGNKKEAWESGFHGWLRPASLKGRRDKERRIAKFAAYGSTVAPLYTANTAGKLSRVGTIDLAKEFKSPSIQTPAPSPSVPPATPKVETKGLLALLWELLSKIFRKAS